MNCSTQTTTPSVSGQQPEHAVKCLEETTNHWIFFFSLQMTLMAMSTFSASYTRRRMFFSSNPTPFGDPSDTSDERVNNQDVSIETSPSDGFVIKPQVAEATLRWIRLCRLDRMNMTRTDDLKHQLHQYRSDFSAPALLQSCPSMQQVYAPGSGGVAKSRTSSSATSL